jgi:hypothetical protein
MWHGSLLFAVEIHAALTCMTVGLSSIPLHTTLIRVRYRLFALHASVGTTRTNCIKLLSICISVLHACPVFCRLPTNEFHNVHRFIARTCRPWNWEHKIHNRDIHFAKLDNQLSYNARPLTLQQDIYLMKSLTGTKNFKHQQMHKEFFLVNYNTLLRVSTLLGHLQGETFRCRYTMLHYTV